MIDHFKEVSEFAKLEIPESHKLPIAIVGAGGIVDGAHLPAYKKAGLEIVGITDVDQGALSKPGIKARATILFIRRRSAVIKNFIGLAAPISVRR